MLVPLIACLAVFIQGAAGQNLTGLFDTTDVDGGGTTNNTSVDTQLESVVATPQDSGNNTSGADADSNVEETPTDPDTAPSAENSTTVFNGTDKSDPSDDDSNLTPNNATSSSDNTAANVPQAEVTDHTAMKILGVSDECSDVVQHCFEKHANESFKKFMFCDAFSDSKTCISENVTEGPTVKTCSAMERKLLEIFMCEPSKLRLSVSPDCMATVSQCAASELTATDKTSEPDSKMFRAKLCDSMQKGDCLGSRFAVCSKGERDKISDSLPCSAMGHLSSALLIAVLLFVNKLI